MDVLITRVGKAETPLLERVAEEVFDAEITAEYLDDYLAEPNHLMCIAVADGVVVGQGRAIILKNPDRVPELFIENLGVTPAFRRQGIATRLLDELRAFGKERGCEQLWVGTESDNAPAIALYRTLGIPMTPMVLFEGKLT